MEGWQVCIFNLTTIVESVFIIFSHHLLSFSLSSLIMLSTRYVCMLRENEDSALQDNLSIDYSADMAMVCIPSEVNLKLDLSFCRPKQGQHLKHCLVA